MKKLILSFYLLNKSFKNKLLFFFNCAVISTIFCVFLYLIEYNFELFFNINLINLFNKIINTDSSLTHQLAFTPLVFFKNLFNLYIKISRKLGGLYIRFLYYCVTSIVAWFILLTILILTFANVPITTFYMAIFLGILELCITIFTITSFVKISNSRKHISNISGLSETLLLQGFTYVKFIILAVTIFIAMHLANLYDFYYMQSLLLEVLEYQKYQIANSLPIDENVCSEIIKKPSYLKLVAHLIEQKCIDIIFYIKNFFIR